jgi:hypothetical protein
MMCLRASRLKIGRSARPAGLGQLPSGILIGRFSGPRESVACAGRQSLGQRGKDISACGEKSSPSPWSSPNLGGLAAWRDESGIFGANRGESNQVQANELHRRDAEARKDCGVGEGTRERVEASGDGGRGESNQERLEAKGLRRNICDGGGNESNQVQANAFFLGDAGVGARTATGTGADARSVGLLPNIICPPRGLRDFPRRQPGRSRSRLRQSVSAKSITIKGETSACFDGPRAEKIFVARGADRF